MSPFFTCIHIVISRCAVTGQFSGLHFNGWLTKIWSFFGSLKLFSLIKGLGVWKLLNKRFCRIIHSHDFEEITDNFLVFTSLFPPSLNPKTYNYIQESRFLCLYWRSRNLLQKRWTRSVTYTADLELDYMGALATTTATATKTSLKMWSRAASNFIALIPSRSIHQMLSIFSGVEL